MATKDVKDVKDIKDDTSATSSSKLFTRAEVAKHTEPNDTWIVIHNNVYNVTPFLNEVTVFFILPTIILDPIISIDYIYQSLLSILNTIDVDFIVSSFVGCIFIKFNLLKI